MTESESIYFILTSGIGIITVLGMYLLRNNTNLCTRVTKMETLLDSVIEKLDELAKDRDKFHPRKD